MSNSNTYEIKDIQPIANDAGNLASIYFSLRAVLENRTDFAEGSWLKTYEPPLELLNTYTPQALQAMCEEIAAANEMYAFVDQVLARRAMPVAFTPPVIAVIPPPPTDAEIRQELMAAVDDAVAFTYNRFQRFKLEYDKRVAAADAYVNSGYTIDPTSYITKFADNTGISYQACALAILEKNASLELPLELLSGLRMDKYKILNAPTLDDARAEFNSIMAQRNVIDRGLQ
jgi:hypothetical protein